VPLPAGHRVHSRHLHQLEQVVTHLDISGRLRATAPADGSWTEPAAQRRLTPRSPEEAARLWQAVVDGEWSLVAHHEADGRRVILARRNAPAARDPRALAPREREVLAYVALGHANKYIGYVLGISPATVAARLRTGLVKLGLRSRRELIQVLGPLVRTGSPPTD
jgi:DNA-binding CsgD family transcriptional regulator